MYPYHVHALLPTDYPLRVRLPERLLQENARNIRFTADILAIEEDIFNRNGITNLYYPWRILTQWSRYTSNVVFL